MNQKVKNYWFYDLVLEAKEKISAFVVILLLIFSLILFFYFIIFYQFKDYPTKYKGKVVEKRVSIRETMFGSKISEILILQGKDDKNFGVYVNGEEYDKTNIGDFIENKGNGVVKILNY